MVSAALRDYIARACASADGVVAWAFRRALGIERTAPARHYTAASVDRYDGILECFENRTPRPL